MYRFILSVSRIHIILILCVLYLSLSVNIVSASFYTSSIVPSSYRNIGTPEGILVLSDNNLWYADSTNYRIVKISPTGTILRTVGQQGTDEGEFQNTVKDITMDDDGNLYVLDYCHVTKMDSNGGYQKSWGSCGNGDVELSDAKGIVFSSADQVLYVSDSLNHRIKKYDLNGNLLLQFGENGTNNGQFIEPHGLGINQSGDLYVVDTNNHRVQSFSSDGVYLDSWGTNNIADPDYLQFPKDVVILSNNNLVVTSQNSQKIKILDGSNGSLIAEWGSLGSDSNQFQYPQYVASNPNNENLWVTDWGLKRLQQFDNTGSYVGIITNSGSSDGLFTTPYAVDFDNLGNMFVLDITGRVQKFNSEGTYQSTPIEGGLFGSSAYHIAISPLTQNIFVSEESKVSIFNSAGILLGTLGNHGENGANSGNGDFNQARGMAFDSTGNIYVTDLFNNRVQKFDPTQYDQVGGGYIGKWDFYYPENIYIDESNNIYVSAPNPEESADPSPQVVRKYDSNGVFQEDYLSQYGALDTEYWKISGIWIRDGKIYISDPNNDRLQVYNVSDKSWSETIGSHGAGSEQYDFLRYSRFNPISEALVVVDSGNHRLEIMNTGVKINNLIPSADVIKESDSNSLVSKPIDPTSPGASSLEASLYFGDYIVSDFTVNLTTDRNWESVNTIALPEESKALVVNLNPSDAPGISDTHSIYVVKQVGQNAVRVCTDAILIGDLTSDCVGYSLREGDSQLSSVTIDSIDYWKVTGLTGTGVLGQVEVVDVDSPTTSTSVTTTNTVHNSNFDTSCSYEQPVKVPDLFQIDTSSTSAKIFFSPADYDTYTISFSTNPDAIEHNATVTLYREGVQNYQVNLLKPGTTYYFKVRTQNGCATGNWSNIMSAVTPRQGLSNTIKWYRYGKKAVLQRILPLSITNIIHKEENIKQNPLISNKPPIASSQTSLNKEVQKTKKCFLWICW